MSKDPKEVVLEMVEMIGKRKAERLLVNEKVSTSVAGKLVRGKYECEVGEWIADAIARARTAAASQAS